MSDPSLAAAGVRYTAPHLLMVSTGGWSNLHRPFPNGLHLLAMPHPPKLHNLWKQHCQLWTKCSEHVPVWNVPDSARSRRCSLSRLCDALVIVYFGVAYE